MKHLIRWLAIFLTLASCAPLRPPDERLAEAEARINLLEEEISRAEAAYRKAEQSLNEANRNLERQRAIESRLRQDLQESDEKLDKQIEEIQEAREDAESAKAKLEEKRRALVTMSSTNATLKDQLTETKKELDLASRKAEKLVPELTPEERLAFLEKVASAMATWGVLGTSEELEKVPERMNIEDSFTFRLVIQPSTGSVTLTKIENKFKNEFKVEDTQLKEIVATGTMSAELSGKGLTIEPVGKSEDEDGSVVKPVSLNEETRWEWDVEAKKEGKHRLRLLLYAHSKGGSTEVLKEPPWDIDVYETAGQKIAGFTGENYQWIWTAVIIPIVGWIYQVRKSRKG